MCLHSFSFQHSQHPTLSTESIAESSYKTLTGSRGILGDFNHYVPSVAASPGFSLHHAEPSVPDQTTLPRFLELYFCPFTALLFQWQVSTVVPRIDERPILSGHWQRVSHMWRCPLRSSSVEVEQHNVLPALRFVRQLQQDEPTPRHDNELRRRPRFATFFKVQVRGCSSSYWQQENRHELRQLQV